MSDKDGGPAFPCAEDMRVPQPQIASDAYLMQRVEHVGLSLRDYFAAQAMTRYQFHSGTDDIAMASRCYQIADAMLKERAK